MWCWGGALFSELSVESREAIQSQPHPAQGLITPRRLLRGWPEARNRRTMAHLMLYLGKAREQHHPEIRINPNNSSMPSRQNKQTNKKQ